MLKKFLPLAILISCVILVALTNFSSSYLAGWDDLLPELNIGLNIKRAIFSVWQQEGLGYLAGNGHAAELPRQILLWPLTFIFPVNFIRQIYIFSMLLTGVLGAYFLIRKLVFYGKGNLLNSATPVVGALFYLFNLATVQTFFVPFEPFITSYAFLPWLILSALNLIANRDKKSLILFIVVNVLAIPQAQVPTVFFVYLFSLSIFLLVLVWETKRKTIFSASLKVILLTLILNAFWLLPFIYFYLTNSSVAFEAKINQMSTQTVFLQNKEFGNLTDVVLLKGFWFGNVDPNKIGVFDFMMKPWKDYLNGFPTYLGFVSFFFILLGFIYVKRKRPFVIPFSALFILSFTMLATNTPPFSWIDSILRGIPIFAEVFRFPFTKFSILAGLTYSFFFAIGVGKLASLLKDKAKIYILFILAGLLVLALVFPIFKGNLFYERERVSFPPEYKQLSQYFSSKPTTARIANFPQHTLWGWNYYRWGYGGSGFLWYSLPQPILDRAFDVWSGYSENYYWEISYALYSKNAPLFEKVLQKYNVEYLIIDKNVISAYSQDSLFIPELEEMLSKLPRIQKDSSFGPIDVYKVQNTPSYTKTVRTSVNGYKFGDFDRAYLELGDYITTDSQKADIVYPFRSLFSGKNEENKEFKVEINSFITFISGKDKLNVPKEETDYYLNNEVKNCDNFRKGKYSSEFKDKILKLYSKDAIACTSLELNILPAQGYLLAIDNKNTAGRGLHVWVLNENKSNPLIDTYLSQNKELTTSYFVIPPQDDLSRKYSLHLDNSSIVEESKNEIGKIALYPIPHEALTSYKRVQKVSPPVQVLTLNEAYNDGWGAYQVGDVNLLTSWFPFIFGRALAHVKIDNWENGFVLQENSKQSPIVIVYLPQYLEYLGFAILGIGLVYLIVKNLKLKLTNGTL